MVSTCMLGGAYGGGAYRHHGRGILPRRNQWQSVAISGNQHALTMGEEFCHVEADTASSDDGDALAHLMREAINEDEGGNQRSCG